MAAKEFAERRKQRRGNTASTQTSKNESGRAVRDIAVETLRAIRQDGRTLEAAFLTATERGDLTQRDRGLARAIILLSLRHYHSLGAVLESYLDRGWPARSGAFRDILTVAAAQIIELRVPAHAAINIAVEQARSDRRAVPFAKLANAVLRRVSETGAERFEALTPGELDVPAWMRRRWEEAYGAEKAQSIAAASLTPAALDLTVKPDPAVAAMADGAGWLRLPTGSYRSPFSGAVEAMDGYADGHWWVQDAAAAIPVGLLRFAPGDSVLDVCAAPGGKTAQLVARGAHVTALDKSKNRLARVSENLERLSYAATLLTADALKWQPDQLFGAVLLDAPCSASGTLRRHPEMLHNRTEDSWDALVDTQRALLARVAGWLKPGGSLVYCVCSLEPTEGPGQVTDAICNSLGLVADPIVPGEASVPAEFITSDGDLRTFPDDWDNLGENVVPGLDGFFAARFRKSGERK